MEKYNNAPTLSGTMEKLKTEGYTEDFNLNTDCVNCRNSQINIFPSEFQIDKYFRFEGLSDPADGSILYAISSEKYDVKGLLVDGYGIYSEPLTSEMIARFKTPVL